VPGFAYPYGDLDKKARSAVEAAGFEYACSTRSGPAVSGSDALALRRVQVLDWDGNDFEKMLRSFELRGA
jgi:hypothetical protein